MAEKIRTTPPRLRLGTIGEVKTELCRLYREARSGRVDWSDATKATHLLNTIARLIELEAEEGRRVRSEDEHRETMAVYGLIGPNGEIRG